MKKRNILLFTILALFLSSCGIQEYPSEDYTYNAAYHWSGSKTVHDKKLFYQRHKYKDNRCKDCGYVKNSSEYLTYKELSNGTLEVAKCDKSAVEITIPHFYKNKKITSIAERAFKDCSSLINVKIPNSLTELKKRLFVNCTSLKTVTIPHSITYIDYELFENCPLVTALCEIMSRQPDWNIYWASSAARVIWDYKGKIGEMNGFSYAVCGAQNDSSGYINVYAIDPSMEEIEIPSYIDNIPVILLNKDAFKDCTSLRTLILPETLNYIRDEAFKDCESLTVLCRKSHYSGDWINSVSHIVWEYAGEIGTLDGLSYAVCQNNDQKYISIYNYDESKEVLEIPASINDLPVMKISDKTFERCFSLKSVVLPNGITSIGDEAFQYCTGLTDIVIPDTVSYIGTSAFSLCRALTSVVIPDKVTQIYPFTFLCCDNLASVTLSMNLEYIGTKAFAHCFNLASIIIPGGVSEISRYAFDGCNSLSYVKISKGVKFIGECAFSFCGKLHSIIIPNTVEKVEKDAFFSGDFSMIVFGEAKSEPSGWEAGWNNSVAHVYWGYLIQPQD